MKNILLLSIYFILLVAPKIGSTQEQNTPIKVEIVKNDDGWQLLRGGEPYYIRGVGGQVKLDKAVEYGANSIRTWGVDEAIGILDSAHARGLSVLFGLWVGVERQGFDYSDAKAVQAQLEGFTEVVKKYKDHPAILMWGIGNEADLFYSDFRVWNAINDIAKMIHELDPNHPTMTVTAGLDVAEVQLIKERAPHIDVYGINTYAQLIGIDEELRAFGWDRPYVIAEWGPSGHWEVEKTDWGVPIEQTSSEKAVVYRERYLEGIARDPEMCIGSYVFLWGQKQETTPTWYGLFLEDGTETAVMDVLEEMWTGNQPKNRAPALHSVLVNDKPALKGIFLKPGRYFDVKVEAEDPDGDPLTFVWEMLPESTDIKSGGDKESRPEAVKLPEKPNENENTFTFKSPTKEGPYRLFMYIYDGKGKAATANIPIYIDKNL
jgi:hypothetical protein